MIAGRGKEDSGFRDGKENKSREEDVEENGSGTCGCN